VPVYSEGPFRQWTAVHWPSGQFWVSGWIDFSPLDSIGTIAPFPAGRVIPSGGVFRGLLHGETSGAEVNLTNVPADVGAFSLTQNPFPDCGRTYNNGYDLTGAPVSAPPARCYNITATGVVIAAHATQSAGASVCSSDFNGIGLGASFLLGEMVTITYPAP
jgi:hypothetical protein